MQQTGTRSKKRNQRSPYTAGITNLFETKSYFVGTDRVFSRFALGDH